MDGHDDGSGDFKKLGVNRIWLLPFYPSPRLDHAYDVTDY
jgi:maltose alpha-D-glucosyltransferase/alpha-amylase